MNECPSSERTLEETRCKLDSRVLNRCTKHERRQLENDYASVSNMIQCERDKIAEIKSVLSSLFGSDNACLTTGHYSIPTTASEDA